ncbi:MAG: invasion associated locus B family protein, partial [Xanthobacteraceae bacterium]
MNYRTASAPARRMGRTPAAVAKRVGLSALLTIALALGLQAATGSLAFAQAPKPAAKKPAAPAAPAAPA